MRTPLVALLVLLASLAGLRAAEAKPVRWAGNGHYYEVVLVPGGISWTQANAAATAAGGYLATLTSAAEDAFVFALLDNAAYWSQEPAGSDLGPWIGAYQTSDNGSNPAANWVWVSGEPWSYTNWASDEPNNYTGSLENYLSFKCSGTANCRANVWNDLPDQISAYGTFVRAYVAEYNYAAGVGDRPASPGLSFTNSPNPFRGATSLRFVLVAPAPVRLTVMDAQGRRVRELVRGSMNAGAHESTWDGRDAGGGLVPPGTYFANLDVAGARRTIALSVVR
jgi:hypothetical protein